MYRGYRIVAIVPTKGEKRHLEILLTYLRRSNMFDEIRLILNEGRIDDIAYVESLKSCTDTWINPYIKPWCGTWMIEALKDCQDSNTIYYKIDGDVVFVDTHAVERLINYRINNPEPFIVSANVVNNGVCNYYCQQAGVYDSKFWKLTCRSNDGFSFMNMEFIKWLHEFFLEHAESGNVERFYIPNVVLSEYTYFSVNNYAIFGRDLIGLTERMPIGSDEGYVTQIFPREFSRPCEICGNSVVVHYSFHTQRDFLNNNPSILERYEKLASVI